MGDDGDHDHDHDHGDDSDHTRGHDHDGDHHHHDAASAGIAAVTVSTSRTLADDPSGDAIEELVGRAGNADVVARDLVGDDREALGATLDELLADEAVDAVVTTGGTGITGDDVTIETASERFDKELPGFGETFRRRSEEEIGPLVVGTRATAGVADGTVVFAVPGSENAARTGTDLILQVVGHLVGLAGR